MLELINKFRKVAEYKINREISLFPYTSKEISEKEIRKELHHNSIKNNKIFRNKFNQEGERSMQLKLLRLWWKKLKKTYHLPEEDIVLHLLEWLV